jgi:hemerythrin superfamily protein
VSAEPDVIALLRQDHRDVERLFASLEAQRSAMATRDAELLENRRSLVDRVIVELVQHSVAEEQYLYPAVRTHLPDGDEIADRELSDHAAAERTMKALDSLSPDNVEFDSLVHQLMSEVRQHVVDEEQQLFPRLHDAVSHDELVQLGAKVQRAKRFAPTHPHPVAPDRPPANKLLGPAVALVDRVRDVLTGRG